MLSKVIFCLAILALCYTPSLADVKVKNCTETEMEDGETEVDCDGKVVYKNKNGQTDVYQLLDNQTMTVFKFPEGNKDGCFVFWKNSLPSGEGLSYAQFDKDEDYDEADPELAAAISQMFPDECTNVPVFELKDAKEDNQVSSRKKRGCYYRIRCRVYYYWKYYYGQLTRFRRVVCRRLRICFGK